MAHNCKNFDSIRLMNALKQNQELTEKFADIVIGFIDTKPYFQKRYPKKGPNPSQIENHQLDTVVKFATGGLDYEKHCAVGDSRALSRAALAAANGSLECLRPHSFSLADINLHVLRASAKNDNLPSLQGIQDTPSFAEFDIPARKQAYTKATAKLIAESGLQLEHLMAAFKEDPKDGIENLFNTKDKNGTVRVSVGKRVIKRVNDFLRANDELFL